MPRSEPRKTHERGDKWWVVHQHDDVKVVKSAEMPSAEVEDGERMKRIHGPAATEAEAKELAESIYSRTLKGMAEREGLI